MKQELSQESLEQFPLMTGRLPDGWSVAFVADIAVDITPGFASGEHDSGGKGHPHMRPMNIDRSGRIDLSVVKSVPSTQDRTLSCGDVLFNNTNSPDLVGKTALIGARESGFAFSNHMTRIRVKEELSPNYVAHFLHFLWMSGYIKHRCTNHVNQASVSSKTLANTVPLLIPPSNEQARIVEKLEELLSDLDAGVAELKAAQRKLAQYRQSLLRAAVEGVLTADWRVANGKPQESGAELLQRIRSERRARWEQKQLAKFAEQGKPPPKGWQAKYSEPVAPDLTGLPPLPEGWTWASLGQLLESMTSGSRDWAPYYDRGACIFVMAQNVRPWRPDFTFRQFVDPPPNDRDRARSMVEKDDLLITIVGANTGQCCRVPQELKDHFVCQSVALLRVTKKSMSEFVNAVLNSSEHGQRQFREMNYGAGRPHLSFEQIESVVVPMPPAAEQEQILSVIEEGSRQMEAIEVEIAKALKQSAAQRKNLLKAAFAGQLVPQDPNDEPASELLVRIRAERASNDGGTPRRRRKTA